MSLFALLPHPVVVEVGTYDGQPAELRWISGEELAVVSEGQVVQSMAASSPGALATLRTYLDAREAS